MQTLTGQIGHVSRIVEKSAPLGKRLDTLGPDGLLLAEFRDLRTLVEQFTKWQGQAHHQRTQHQPEHGCPRRHSRR